MQKNKTLDCEGELTRIINSVYPAGNYNAIDNFASNLIMMTLKTFQNGKHPVINGRDFRNDVLPVPNMTILDHGTGQYTGVKFNSNCSIVLDLFSLNKNIDSRNFISIEELERMKLCNYIKYEDRINIIAKNQWVKNKNHHNSISNGLTSIHVVNTESLRKSAKNPRGVLNESDFNLYFPDFGKQTMNFINYSNKLKKLIQKNNPINIDYLKNSYLPKLSSEMANYQFCRLTGCEYTPKFTREDHLTDIIKLHSQNRELLKGAIKQSYMVADVSINHLLGNDKTASIAKTNEQKQKAKVHERKLSYQ